MGKILKKNILFLFLKSLYLLNEALISSLVKEENVIPKSLGI